ncbi:lycopene cyclase domain-containing protein [uncultured Microbacterium sp.]|uniref:lycopene cyclase domain-containing protein n=1 Tax=uncultured Microbacterium sp. TaxID=191216 RepID=UPI002625C812|nr:lycopene cyclase domain-containing protein [uncultured Microbacterium sp.]
MTYLLLAGIFLAIAGVSALILRARTRHPRRAGVRLPALLLGGAALLILTAVFDTVMIAVGLFTYADEHIIGLRIGLAPLEDFAYPLAALILLPALWAFLRSRHDH